MSSGNLKLLLGGVLTLCAMIGYITMAVLLRGDPDAANIRGSFLFLIAPATALLVAGQTQDISDRTKTIERQTNGVLHAKIQETAQTAADAAVQAAIASPDLPAVGPAGNVTDK